MSRQMGWIEYTENGPMEVDPRTFRRIGPANDDSDFDHDVAVDDDYDFSGAGGGNIRNVGDSGLVLNDDDIDFARLLRRGLGETVVNSDHPMAPKSIDYVALERARQSDGGCGGRCGCGESADNRQRENAVRSPYATMLPQSIDYKALAARRQSRD